MSSLGAADQEGEKPAGSEMRGVRSASLACTRVIIWENVAGGEMRAVVVQGPMEPGDLKVSEVAGCEAGPGEVVIGVRAAGCNYSDLLMLRGEYQVKPVPPFVPGREASGVVAEVGPGVDRVNVGDRVLAYTDLGSLRIIGVDPDRK